MPQKKTAVVVVSKDWINTRIRHLLNEGDESRSTGSTHILFADVEDISDERGLWLNGVKTTRLKKTDQLWR